MSAHLLELVDPPISPSYPTEVDLTQGTFAERMKAWRHRLVGKKLLLSRTVLTKEMESVSAGLDILFLFYYSFFFYEDGNIPTSVHHHGGSGLYCAGLVQPDRFHYQLTAE
jgi:hypothetical protein